MSDRYIPDRVVKNWKSLVNGNEYPFARYSTRETEHKGFLPLPKEEYPFTLTYDYNRGKWLRFIGQ